MRKTQKEPDNQELIDSCDYMAGAASAQDCTGLIPANPLSDEVMESYEAIYPYEPPEMPHRKLPED